MERPLISSVTATIADCTPVSYSLSTSPHSSSLLPPPPPRQDSTATSSSANSPLLTTLVLHLYSSPSSSSPSTPPSIAAVSSTSNSTSSPHHHHNQHSQHSLELISQLTVLVSLPEHKLSLQSLKLLFYQTFQYFLSNQEYFQQFSSSSNISSPSSSSTSFDIPRQNIKAWQDLIQTSPQLSENLTPFTILLTSNIQQLQNYFQNIKTYEKLMFVIGDHSNDLEVYSNWIVDDENNTLADLIETLKKTNKFHQVDHEEDNHHEEGRNSSIPSVLTLVLGRGYEMPAPNIRVLLQQTRTTTDMYGKNYTMYTMVVIQGKLEWTIEHRYSDFAKLHEALLAQDESEMGYIPRHLLPQLTKKKLTSRSLLQATIDKRRIKLCRYINTLVSLEQAMSNHHVLSFLGTINTARFDSVDLSKGISRNTIHISKLRSEAKWGDIILFKCANTLSHLQRRVTRSEWDHVGIVVRAQHGSASEGYGGLELLEATGEGVTSYPLTGRLKAYYFNNFTKYMAIRQLKSFERTAERLNLLDEFVAQVVGKPYGFTASQIFPSKNTSHQSTSTTRLTLTSFWNTLTGGNKEDSQDEGGGDEITETYFCSELVAAAQKHMGLLPSSLNPGYFWPGCFAKGDELDNLIISSVGTYGDELILDCRVMEISRAVEKRPSHLIKSIYEPDDTNEQGSSQSEQVIAAPKSTFVPSLF